MLARRGLLEPPRVAAHFVKHPSPAAGPMRTEAFGFHLQNNFYFEEGLVTDASPKEVWANASSDDGRKSEAAQTTVGQWCNCCCTIDDAPQDQSTNAQIHIPGMNSGMKWGTWSGTWGCHRGG